jgi:hypothetical protein
MRRRATVTALLVAGVVALVGSGCSVSPEAERVRGGGPGADIGNHGAVVEMHGPTNPSHQVPSVGKSAKTGTGFSAKGTAPAGTQR